MEAWVANVLMLCAGGVLIAVAGVVLLLGAGFGYGYLIDWIDTRREGRQP